MAREALTFLSVLYNDFQDLLAIVLLIQLTVFSNNLNDGDD